MLSTASLSHKEVKLKHYQTNIIRKKLSETPENIIKEAKLKNYQKVKLKHYQRNITRGIFVETLSENILREIRNPY